MIELRWLTTSREHIDPLDGPFQAPVRVLQYRVLPSHYICVEGTYEEYLRQLPEWQDVPEVIADFAAHGGDSK